MEQVSALAERIRVLKSIAASIQEGAIHTRLFPEVDTILALPDDLVSASVAEREAVARQVREHEQVFDQLGYSLLKQIMPTTGVSPIFQVVRAADAFRRDLRRQIGREVQQPEGARAPLTHHDQEVLTRYSLSIGTPPVTASMRELVCRVLLGRPVAELLGLVELLQADPEPLDDLLRLLERLVASSLHYATLGEEHELLDEASDFVNFEGGRIFNRVLVTESPERVMELIQDHVFDKFGTDDAPPVYVVEGVDSIDAELVARMRDNPNQVFVVRVTRLPHRLFDREGAGPGWRSVMGRLLLIDCSERARRSNTTIVYTLFPHVARTLRNIQTSLAGRPAGTQMQLRRILERFSATELGSIRAAITERLAFLERQDVLGGDVEKIRAEEWRRQALGDYLALVKLRRLLDFLLVMAGSDEAARRTQGEDLRQQVARDWLRYFYNGLPADEYRATVVPGGGRGTLTLLGEYHRRRVWEAVEAFRTTHLQACRRRLEALKRGMQIPESSTDEIQAAIKQSQLRALSPTQWKNGERVPRRSGHLARSALYRLADATSRVTRRTREGLDRAAFGNVTGNVAAYLKRTFSDAGLGALHGHLEDQIGARVGRYDRRVRDVLTPFQELIHSAQRAIDDLKGELDPIAVADIEVRLELVEQGHFYPTLILPEMAWSYRDVFPDKYFPAAAHIIVPLNESHEMDPLALLAHLEELRYQLRRLPELFQLVCASMLLVINSPHNPTGVYYRRETVLRLLKIAAEYGITVVDDNAYHKLVFSWQKAREGEDSVAQLYEKYRAHFTRPVRLLTAGATTKGLQGAGDRTGFLCSRDAEAVAFCDQRASAPHQLSLYLTRAKLEAGLEAKRQVAELERIAGQVLIPSGSRAALAEVRRLLDRMVARLGEPELAVVVFDALLEGYEELLRAHRRGATRRDLQEVLSGVVARLKQLRLERRLRSDVEQRMSQVKLALLRAVPERERIEPQGAFYACVRLCAAGEDRGVHDFLTLLSRQRKIDLSYAGQGFVRLSLGGELEGDRSSYDRLGQSVEIYLRLMDRYWRRYEELGRDAERLALELQGGAGGDPVAAALADLDELRAIHPAAESRPRGLRLAPSERGTVYTIEEGRSLTEKIYAETEGCTSVEQLLDSRTFRVVYRRLLKVIYRDDPTLSEIPLAQLEDQYGPLACQRAYRERQLMDADFRRIMTVLYRAWHGRSVIKTLAAPLRAGAQAEKVAALHGLNRRINELINELMHAFELGADVVTATSTFAVGYEVLRDIRPHEALPPYLGRIISKSSFAAVTAPLDPAPVYVTGATRRVADYRYGFIRRDGSAGARASSRAPELDYFRARLTHLGEHLDGAHYVCKAVQVGPFPMLLVIHKSYLHLLNDELRLFPQLDAVQEREELDRRRWEGVLLFGVPAEVLGGAYRTGYIMDETADGQPLPTAWVAREDATDYTGFLKKSLLTLHNEQVKALGGMPVHGAMITITFVNGLRKTLVLSADSGTGKSETITAMMEQSISRRGLGAEIQKIDILAGDMLSLWQGEDGQLYAFGTETGDFLRLPDITESWKARFGDLLRRGSTSNPDHPTNPRVTIPGICDAQRVLTPTRVNGFFYINNYDAVAGSAVELSDDPHHVLKTILVRGLRKNKGTSGDQPSLRAGLAFAGRTELVTRYRHALDELLEWEPRELEGRVRTCLVYRDGTRDVFKAREIVSAAFVGAQVTPGQDGGACRVQRVDHDVMQNMFWLVCDGGRRAALDRRLYDQVYEPLVSTFCGNPFVDPEGMDVALGRFAELMRSARVHTGVIRTQLARPGQEFAGPERAAQDVVAFLMEDEEVNARFQRNKDKVSQAMQACYGGVLPAGSNLPVELEGFNLLLLEKYESTHVRFIAASAEPFVLDTPLYAYHPPDADVRGSFIPAVALPEMLATIGDIVGNPDHDLDLDELEVDLGGYGVIRHWNSLEELTYQVLLVNGVINLGSSETELALFPAEVRKAYVVACRLAARPGLPA